MTSSSPSSESVLEALKRLEERQTAILEDLKVLCLRKEVSLSADRGHVLCALVAVQVEDSLPLEKRTAAFENSVDGALLRVARAGARCGASMIRVRDGYYDLELIERAMLIGAPNGQSLCRTLVLDNKAPDAPRNVPRRIAVVIPYTSKLHSNKLDRAAREVLNAKGIACSKKDIHYQAMEKDLLSETGFRFNGTAPLGLLPAVSSDPQTPDQSVMLLVSDDVKERFWAGGGEPDVKLFFPNRAAFVKVFDAALVDVSYD